MLKGLQLRGLFHCKGILVNGLLPRAFVVSVGCEHKGAVVVPADGIDAAGNLLRVSQDDSGIMPLLNDPNLQNPNMNMMNQGLGSLIGAPQVINNEYIYGLPMGFLR